jgi:MinD-like ATPase involved in chromosome partitioning or flagellar assembly
MSAVPLLLAVPDLSQEPELVARLTRPGAPVMVARRCVDAVDLIGAAAAGGARIAVISAGLPRLGRDTLARLAAAQVKAIGLVLDGDEPSARSLRALDVPVVTVPVDDLDLAVAALARAVDDPRPSTWEYSGAGSGAAPPVAAAEGMLIAVWGPTGAPGRTSVAVGLADEMSRLGMPALLVDADTHGGAVATHLGLLDDVSGIVLACRQADAGTLDAAGLASAARAVDSHLRVLTGIAHAGRWAELRPAALGRLWEACRMTPGVTVVDTGFGLECDEELLHDTRSPRRHAATLTAVTAADAIVAVGSGDPVGIERLIAGLGDLRRVAPDTPVHVVVTRVRRRVLGRDPEGQIREALRLHAGIMAVTCVPDDGAAYDACLREGRTLAETAPRSPARGVLREFARGLAPTGRDELAVSA